MVICGFEIEPWKATSPKYTARRFPRSVAPDLCALVAIVWFSELLSRKEKGILPGTLAEVNQFLVGREVSRPNSCTKQRWFVFPQWVRDFNNRRKHEIK